MWVIVKTRRFYSFTINSQPKLKKTQQIFLGTFTKKNLLRNLTRFHGGFFELEIIGIFRAAFLLKTIISTWIFFKYCGWQSQTTATNIFLLLLFYIEKIIFCYKTYLEKFSLYWHICITVIFRLAGYWKCSIKHYCSYIYALPL